MMGIIRFLNRTWDHFDKVKVDAKKPMSIWMNPVIKKVADDIEDLKYNTAISELMVALRRFEDEKINGKKDIETFLLLLAPFATFMAEELWEKIGNKYSIHQHPWPTYNEKNLQSDKVNLVLQVNGKLRGMIVVDRGLTQKQIQNIALSEPKVITALDNKKLKKIIYIQDKVLNLVI